MTAAASDPSDRPPPARRSAGITRRRPGRGRRPGIRPLRQHQARLSAPSGGMFNEWCGDSVGLRHPCRRSLSPWHATWPSAPALAPAVATLHLAT